LLKDSVENAILFSATKTLFKKFVHNFHIFYSNKQQNSSNCASHHGNTPPSQENTWKRNIYGCLKQDSNPRTQTESSYHPANALNVIRPTYSW